MLTIFSHFESKGDQQVQFDDVLSVWVYNNGECIAVIDGFPIYPKQKATIIIPDNYPCDASLNLSFKPVKVVNPVGAGSKAVQSQVLVSDVPNVIPSKIAPELRKTILFYFKKQLTH